MKSGYPIALSLSLACGVASFTLVDAADVPEVHYQSRDQNHRIVVRDSIGIDLIRVEPGEYLMGGSEPAEKVVQAFPGADVEAEDFADEYPRHRVRITRPFFLGKFEVTVAQFRRFVDETRYKTEAEQDGTGGWGYSPETAKSEGRRPYFNWRSTGYPQTDQYPVVNVTYNDALAFIGWLSTSSAFP